MLTLSRSQCIAQVAQLAAEHEGVTVLFLDVVGFTQMSKVRISYIEGEYVSHVQVLVDILWLKEGHSALI
jgi:hypothetical protein